MTTFRMTAIAAALIALSLSAGAETLTTDIVVVGAGAAGLSAAVNSADHGAKVVVLEKMPFPGGASAVCGGQYAIQGSDLQKAKGVKYDPPQALVYDLIGNGHLHNDLTTLKVLAEESPAAANWAIKRFDLKFIDQPLQYRAEFQFDRSLYLVGGCGPMFQSVLKASKEKGVKILTNTKVEELIVEDGEVVGVRAKAKDGSDVTVKAKAVLLATGGPPHGAEDRRSASADGIRQALSERR